MIVICFYFNTYFVLTILAERKETFPLRIYIYFRLTIVLISKVPLKLKSISPSYFFLFRLYVQRAMSCWHFTVILILMVNATKATSTPPRPTYHRVDSEPTRKTVGEITVNNGGSWGEWMDPLFCPNETYAVGYRTKANLVLISNKISFHEMYYETSLLCLYPKTSE